MPKKKTAKAVRSSRKKKVIVHTSFLSLRTKLLFAVGFLFIIIPFFFYINEGIQLAFFTPKVIVTKSTHAYSLPAEVTIPKVNIHLPIAETAISGNTWGIAPDGISHLAISASPGQNGTIILYGHNTNDRFGPIRWLSAGDIITLTTKDGKTHAYKIISLQDVSPNKTTILISQKGETLILYTCDGFADLERFVVIAKPI